MLGYHLGYHIDRMSEAGYSTTRGVNTIYVPIMKGNMSDRIGRGMNYVRDRIMSNMLNITVY